MFDTLYFRDLCCVFEKIKSKSKRAEKQEIFLSLIRQAHQKDLHVNLFPLLSLFLPHLDTRVYHMKEISIAHFYIHALFIATTSITAKRLLQWKDPTIVTQYHGKFPPVRNESRGEQKKRDAEGVTIGNFACAVYQVTNDRCSACPKLYTVQSIQTLLQQLVECTETEKKALYVKLISQMSPLEHKWFTRIVLKNIELGMEETVLFPLLSNQAIKIFNTCSRLETVCEYLQDPQKAEEQGIGSLVPFSFLKPMLASHIEWTKLIALIQKKSYVVEPKFDGGRIQIHKKGDRVRYYTRNTKDATETYQSLSPIILKQVSAESAILDGEMMSWNHETQTFDPIEEIRKEQGVEKQYCFIAFDLVYLNGRVLCEEPLHKRRAYLEDTITPLAHSIELTRQFPIFTEKELLSILEKTLEKKLEGLVVKSTDSCYTPNERALEWIKIRPDHLTGMLHVLDLVILGGWYGNGTRRSGKISHFLMGLWNEEQRKVVSFCKVGTGYTHQELNQLLEKLNPHWIPTHKKQQGKIDVRIDPEKSIVLEVKGYELIKSTDSLIETDYTVRFPRVSRIRWDKKWNDILTLSQCHSFVQQGLHHKSNPSLSAVVRHLLPSKKCVVQDMTKKMTLLSTLFQGHEFCVVGFHPSISELIKRHGGTLVANPIRTTTTAIIMEKECFASKLFQKEGSCNILYSMWIQECIAQKQIMVPSKKHIVCLPFPTKIQATVDRYGDSFTQDVTVDSLLSILNSM